MKSIILTFIIVITTSLAISQVTLGNGYLDKNNELVFESHTELKEGFEFSKSLDNEIVVCLIYNQFGELTNTTLIWDIVKITIDSDMHDYQVIDSDGHICHITFFVDDNIVIILDTNDENKFSSMSGDGLKLKNL